ncbi:MAG: uroporphyrinogen-III synthase, partial [Actinomycetota bacterium]
MTRERPGRLAQLLVAAGATVEHVPLISVVDPADHGALRAALAEPVDWIIVTSPAGAERTMAARLAIDADAGARSPGHGSGTGVDDRPLPTPHVAVVGTATA